MLSTGTTRTVSINTDIFILDFNIHILLNIRHHIAGYERRLSLTGRVKRRYTHKTVYAFFGLQISVSILSVYLECDRLNACLIAIQRIEYLELKALLIRPAGIHTKKHRCPIARFGASCSCMKRKNRIISVIFTG